MTTNLAPDQDGAKGHPAESISHALASAGGSLRVRLICLPAPGLEEEVRVQIENLDGQIRSMEVRDRPGEPVVHCFIEIVPRSVFTAGEIMLVLSERGAVSFVD